MSWKKWKMIVFWSEYWQNNAETVQRTSHVAIRRANKKHQTILNQTSTYQNIVLQNAPTTASPHICAGQLYLEGFPGLVGDKPSCTMLSCLIWRWAASGWYCPIAEASTDWYAETHSQYFHNHSKISSRNHMLQHVCIDYCYRHGFYQIIISKQKFQQLIAVLRIALIPLQPSPVNKIYDSRPSPKVTPALVATPQGQAPQRCWSDTQPCPKYYYI